MRTGSRIQQIHSVIGGYRPVIMLARAVDAGKRLFMQEAGEIMAFRYLTQYLHGEVIVID